MSATVIHNFVDEAGTPTLSCRKRGKGLVDDSSETSKFTVCGTISVGLVVRSP